MICFRTGFDRRNSSKVKFSGPKIGKLEKAIKLPKFKLNKLSDASIVFSNNNTICVQYKGFLSSITTDGDILWSRSLKSKNYTPPIVINKKIILYSDKKILYLNENGEVVKEYKLYKYTLNVENISPNILNNNKLILNTRCGSVLLLEEEKMEELKDIYGYDILPPAIDSEGSMIFSAYYGNGLIKIDKFGNKIWEINYKEADLIPTINTKNNSAVGSLNLNESIFVSFEGEIIGKYKKASIFSEFLDDEWIALSEDGVARVKNNGEIIWEYKFKENIRLKWGSNQAIVDKELNTYVINKNLLVGLNKYGDEILKFKFFKDEPKYFSIIKDGICAVIVDNKLKLIG